MKTLLGIRFWGTAIWDRITKYIICVFDVQESGPEPAAVIESKNGAPHTKQGMPHFDGGLFTQLQQNAPQAEISISKLLWSNLFELI